MTSQKNSVQLDGLRPDARYVVQVRARTVAGYGQYSHPAEFETTSERGTCPLWLSLPWPILSVPLLTSALLISRLWCPAAPGAASPHCGFCHGWACLRGGCCGHCCRLPQVLPGPWMLSWLTRTSLGTREPSCHIGELSSTLKLEPQSFWAQALLVGKALSSPHPCLCILSPLCPLNLLAEWTKSTGPFAQRSSGCYNHQPRDQLLAILVHSAPPFAQGSLEQRDLSQASLSSVSSRKQRRGSDSEYTEKLQQYSEFYLLIPASRSSLGPHSTLRCPLLLPINAIS